MALVREPWVSLGVGPECAERLGLIPARPARLRGAPQAADDLTLFDLLNQGATMPNPVPAVAGNPETYDTAAERFVFWDLDDDARLSVGPDEPESADSDWHVFLSAGLDVFERNRLGADGAYRQLLRGVSRDQVRQLALELLALTDGGGSGDWRALADRARGKPGPVLRALRDADA